MRNLFWISLVTLAAACSTEKISEKPTTGDDDDDTTVTTDDTSGTDTATSTVGYIDPVAVGFEFDGILRSDGSLTGYYLDLDGVSTYIPPSMYLFFADAEYFELSDPALQDLHYCLAGGTFDATVGVSPMVKPAQNALHDGAVAWWSYESALNVEYHNCTGVVDPKIWGAEGENLWGPFMGAHFGYTLAPMTDYLREAWSDESLTDYGDAMFANYVSINDENGTWIGEDWTTAILWQWDAATESLVVDDKDYLVKLPMDTTPVGGALPEGYVRSFAYWYQDFPLMDFTNLTDGAP